MDTVTLDKVTSRDGTPIAYYRSGAGHPLLLVHGSTADHGRWSSISPQFERHFTVYAMDRRGRGGSGDSPEYDILREAEDVTAVVESISEPVSVLGHSYGGLCSLEAALLTNNISKLILYEPPVPTGLPMYSPDFPERMQALIKRGELETALELFIREEVKMPENELAVYRQLPMWRERIKIVPTLIREMVIDRTYHFDASKFANFRVPTLLMLGSDSPQLFRQAIETLDLSLPNSRLVILPGQQHIAMDTNLELFVGEVLDFLLK
jgi:pimeloyl-ACP methyl ester carboxylesterase